MPMNPSLRSLYDAFNASVGKIAGFAQATYFVGALGKGRLRDATPSSPARFTVATSYQPRVSTKIWSPHEVLEQFTENEHMLVELTHSRLVGLWEWFLDDLFEVSAVEHFEGRRPCVAIEFKTTDANQTAAERAKFLRDEFGLGRSRTPRYDLIEKVRGYEFTPYQLEQIRTHRVVRNAIEHNQGSLSQWQMDWLARAPTGSSARLALRTAGRLTMLDEQFQTHSFGVGDRVNVSIWDVMELANVYPMCAYTLCADFPPRTP